MKILVNGEEKTVPEGLRLSELIASLTLEGNRYAVEVNEELIPRTEHEQHQLEEQDRVEIVQAIGGG
ncbi:MAG: thiamine biosynthesis protein ThiS [Gammaproteobacteria bacterium]|nr:MAG: thiamine biosynthesis protein ThiS [Gammaproteobacteria bacterium]RTZ75944.1 MAG: thiamine biosynthesis protein ThiS [Gammaproteobacteria bacterium]RTZ79713.1 MAG: thiamine biosynthesis protein ThiS [Gammaproteobacteria bacterium]